MDRGGVIGVTLSGVQDWTALGARWRALEPRCDASFFQSWTWTGCLPDERFPDPILAEAKKDGETIGLALFNRRRGLGRARLYLGETGSAPYDGLYIEHNGPLALTEEASAAILAAAARHDDLVLSGLSDAGAEAARAACSGLSVKSVPAPMADLRGAAGDDYLDRRTANTRQQLRRSDRAYAASGPLRIARATTAIEASNWLEEMAVLHQATWLARGKPGCFADPFFGRFHHELIQRGLPREETDLLRITAGPSLIGVLYNFRYRGRALAYQSGFDYDADERTRKPGLTCHHQAIRYYAAEGLHTYDFLAGEDRYKRSLADGHAMLHWIEAGPSWSPRLVVRRARAWLATRIRGVRHAREQRT